MKLFCLSHWTSRAWLYPLIEEPLINITKIQQQVFRLRTVLVSQNYCSTASANKRSLLLFDYANATQYFSTTCSPHPSVDSFGINFTGQTGQLWNKAGIDHTPHPKKSFDPFHTFWHKAEPWPCYVLCRSGWEPYPFSKVIKRTLNALAFTVCFNA